MRVLLRPFLEIRIDTTYAAVTYTLAALNIVFQLTNSNFMDVDAEKSCRSVGEMKCLFSLSSNFIIFISRNPSKSIRISKSDEDSVAASRAGISA